MTSIWYGFVVRSFALLTFDLNYVFVPRSYIMLFFLLDCRNKLGMISHVSSADQARLQLESSLIPLLRPGRTLLLLALDKHAPSIPKPGQSR